MIKYLLRSYEDYKKLCESGIVQHSGKSFNPAKEFDLLPPDQYPAVLVWYIDFTYDQLGEPQWFDMNRKYIYLSDFQQETSSSPTAQSSKLGIHGEVVYTGKAQCMQCEAENCRCYPKLIG
jgi:hypothetical protein